MRFMETVTGYLHKTAKGHMTYDIAQGESRHIFTVATKLEEKFGLKAGDLPAAGSDSAYLELIRNAVKIIVGWDTNSGLFIMATNEEGNHLVQKIAQYLEPLLNKIIISKEKP